MWWYFYHLWNHFIDYFNYPVADGADIYAGDVPFQYNEQEGMYIEFSGNQTRNVFLKVMVKVLIWYSAILYVLSIFGGTLQPNPQQGLTQPWYESSPWGDSDQHTAYIPCRARASAVLPYIFAGTHLTYPQRDGRLSQPVECSTAGPSHISHYGAMLAGWSLIHVLTGLMIA